MTMTTKSGKSISEKTFGTLVCKDKACRHSAVDLNLFDPDLRLVGRYFHFCGYRSLEEVRDLLATCVSNNQDPFAISTKIGKVVDFHEWKKNNT